MNLFKRKQLPEDFKLSIIDEEYVDLLVNELSKYNSFTLLFKNFSKFPVLNILDFTTIKILKEINLTKDTDKKKSLLNQYSGYLKYRFFYFFLEKQYINLIKNNTESLELYFRALNADNLEKYTQNLINIFFKFSKNNFTELFLFLKENYKNEDFFKIFIFIYLKKHQESTTNLLSDIDFTIFDNDENESKIISELILNGKLSKNLKNNAEIFEPSLISLYLQQEILKNEMNNF